jgi:hypothetical protein
VLVLLLTLIPASLPSGAAAATTFQVTNCASDVGAGTLRGQIAAAGNGDTIVYMQDCLTQLVDGTLQIDKNLTIKGNGHSVTLNGQGTLRLINVTSAVSAATIDGLTIQNGGGISNAGALTVTNSVVSGNSASLGGGINNSGTLVVDNSSFANNSAAGAVFINVIAIGGAGGGIYNAGTLTVTNSSFSSNHADSVGGGIYNYRGTATVVNGSFTGNSAVARGGGIENFGALTITNSTFSGNSGAQNGGAIFNLLNSLTITSSTFSGNSAKIGGGIENVGTLTIINSTFSGNIGTSGGGGIVNEVGTSASLTNTIVANSSGSDLGTSLNITSTSSNATELFTFSGSNNLVDQSSEGMFDPDTSSNLILNSPAYLGPLGNYGGATQTIPLLPASPAIDAGSCASGYHDQRGVAQIGSACDIGSFESRGFTLAITGGDTQSTDINTSFDHPLVVTLSEPGGAVLSGADITYAMNPGADGQLAYLSCGFNTCVSTTDANGEASMTARANGTAGSYTVTASATEALTVSFTLTNLPVETTPPDAIPPVTTASATVGDSTTSAYSFGSWANQPVTITLTASDDPGGSDIASTAYVLDGGTQQIYSGSFTVSTDGDHTLTFWSIDNAGNSETARTVHLMIDQTPPLITGMPTMNPNSNGWYNSPVTIHWSCSDSGGSGIAGCPADQMISSEGVNQTANGTATDLAGNTATATSSPGVDIDLTEPVVSANASTDGDLPYASGNWTNENVTIALDAADNGGSGLGPIFYTMGTGSPVTYSAPFTVDTEGTSSIEYWGTDNAGNESTHQTIIVKLDKTGPMISGAPTTSPNSNGWYSGPVTIHWTCNDALSGIQSCPDDQTISTNGASQTAGGTATDNAENPTTAMSSPPVNILIDQTAPASTLTASTAGGSSYTPGGWINQAITITLTASDNVDGSGVAGTFYTLDGGTQQAYVAPLLVSTDGDHSLTFWSIDNAGNIEPAQTVNVMIDQTPPAITYSGNQETYTVDQAVNITGEAVDNLSGLASTTCTTINGTAANFGVGTHTVTSTATDRAGNTASNSVTFTVNVDPNSLAILTQQYAANDPAARALVAPLQLVQKAEQMHNPHLKAAAILLYTTQVNAQRGRSLTNDEANTLIALAYAL